MLGFSLSFYSTLNHLVTFLNRLVEVFEESHVSNIPVVTCLHFCDCEFQVIVKFLCNAEDLSETILLTRILFFHCLKSGFQMLDTLVSLGCLHLKLTDSKIFLSNQGLLCFSLDFFVDNLLFENFNFCSRIDKFLFLSLIGCEKFLQTVRFGCQSIL